MATLNRAFALYGASCHVPELLQVVNTLALLELRALELRALEVRALAQGLERGVLIALSRQAGSC